MLSLPESLKPMAEYAQFINYRLRPKSNGKTDKIPLFPAGQEWQKNPFLWQTAESAINNAPADGGVGFLFTENDPFFFIDIDNCLIDGAWSPVAVDIMSRLPGAAVEVSQSGTGLHIFGRYSGPEPLHSCKNRVYDIELYTSGRFVAMTGDRVVGDASVICDAALAGLIATYFPPRVGGAVDVVEWTTEPVPEYTGPEDDDELIRRACASGSAGSVFGGSGGFKALWEADEDALCGMYPDEYGARAYDESQADAALAQHLAFWTGNNCERIQRVMERSALVRDKWEREDYLIRTILRAVGMQETVYSVTPVADADTTGLKGTAKQVKYAATIRAAKWAECDDERLRTGNALLNSAVFWIDNAATPASDLVALVTPAGDLSNPLGRMKPEIAAGYQYLGAEQQLEFFDGCVYIQESHRVFTPSGALLKTEQFNATYGGFVFQLDDSGAKTTRKAWEAFTESQVVRYPKAESMCFRPTLGPGEIIVQDGRTHVNTYIPIETPRKQGDVSRFLRHLALVLPDQRDQTILLSYMAACVQYKGVKFQWAPLLQGTEGNGKSLFTRCVAAAIGERYVHMPRSSEIDEKFNAWMFNKLFIGVEDIYTPGNKRETIEAIKPMITGERLERRAMQTDQTMADICCNFLFNSNHKDAIKKTQNDRRFAIFYTAQQAAGDVERDGLDGSYFPDLYHWLKQCDGYAMVCDYLHRYPIPDEFNPAGSCHRAPVTSSTSEAITASMGGVEQEIIEAIEEGRPGFVGGWVSSMALDNLLKSKRRDVAIPINKRRELLRALGYDWHPVLDNGRVNNVVSPDNGKPKLFVKYDSPALALATPKEVADAYQTAQTIGVFGG